MRCRTHEKIAATIISILMMFVFSGCDSLDYKKAVSAQEAGDYINAVDIFSKLEDYKDSEERVKECNYAFAKLQAEDKNYIDAIEIFEGLNNYEDSSDLLKQCHLNYALERYEDGDFSDARNHFLLAEQTEIVKKYLCASAWELLQSYIEENGPISKKDESAELIDSKTTAENYTLAIRQGKLTIQAEKSEKSNRKEYGFYLRIEENISTVFSYDIGTETMKLESKFQHHMENNVGIKDSYTTKEGSAIWNICDFVEGGDAKEFIQDVEGEVFYSSLYAQQIGTVVFLQEELPKTNLGITLKDLGFVSF